MCFFGEVIYPDLLCTSQSGLGQQAASEDTGAFCQACDLSLVPMTHIVERKNQLLQILLPSHVYHDMDAHTILILIF